MNAQLVAAEIAAVLRGRAALAAIACVPVQHLCDTAFPRVVCIPRLRSWKGSASVLRGEFVFRLESAEDEDPADAHGALWAGLLDAILGAGRDQFIADVNARQRIYIHGYAPAGTQPDVKGRRRISAATVMLGVSIV